jgi:uncharacterized protein YndB with AHSA1/START domain
MSLPDATNAVLIERIYAAPLERLWQVITDPRHLPQWMCAPADEGCGGQPIVWDFRVGGAIRIPMKGSFGETAEFGTFLEIEAPTRLVYTFRWENDVPHALGETRVTFTLEAISETSTLLKLEHRGFTSHEEVESHTWGWGIALEALPPVLATATA